TGTSATATARSSTPGSTPPTSTREVLKSDYLSPRDMHGYGTHTVSTAAGSAVEEGASFYGLASGTARGGVPRARIAVYKSIWTSAGTGTTATVLAAIDDAIHDGVDVLSMSIDQPGENSFGALPAVQKGIAVVPQTVVNAAPWVITVAASKIDRSIPTVITLGNKQQIVGQSLYYQEKNSSSKSIFRSLASGDLCTKDVLNGTDLGGKIVLCFPQGAVEQVPMPLFTFQKALQNIQNAGGSGIIYAQYTTDTLEGTATCNGIACVLVDLDTGNKIVEYMSATSSPVAKIEPARTFTSKELLAPKVAAFSARGPSIYYADIIKPDIAAPGASILAAKGNSYVTGSGTSMATPHVAGTIALLKALHPEWSPAALKSVETLTLTRQLIRLIYDIEPSEYNKYYGCAISRTTVSCNRTSVSGYHLNLPSISVPDLRHSISISRTVTNVGEVDAVYHAAIQSPPGVKMDIEPSVLVFNATNKFHTFQIKNYTFGSLTWHSGQKTVRIPIAARTTMYDFYADVA
ncbi:hypothetical protein U9M48_026225, partial [Paspalum notatum var. saurae]